MTGGGTGRCLQTTESGGMGEGWSDTMADWLENDSTIDDFVLGKQAPLPSLIRSLMVIAGQYVTNDPAGIRSHPYSRSMTTNPLTYASLQTLSEVHGAFFRSFVGSWLRLIMTRHRRGLG